MCYIPPLTKPKNNLGEKDPAMLPLNPQPVRRRLLDWYAVHRRRLP